MDQSVKKCRLTPILIPSIAPGLLLVVVTVAAYWPALSGGFIWDDDAHLTANPCIVGPLGFREIWTSSSAVYYPLVLTSFWIQHAIWGMAPFYYHLFNVLMHAMAAVLLWRVLLVLEVPGAWLGAALWALHPVQVESVAWITELKNTQSGVFYLLAVLFFMKWRSASGRTARAGIDRNFALVIFFALLAILSKTSTVMLPVVLVLCWWWKEPRWRWRDSIWLVPFFLVSAGAGAWTIWEQKFHSGAHGEEWALGGLDRLAIAGKAVWFYLGKLLWPHPLIFIYPRWEPALPPAVSLLPSLAVVVVLLVLWMGCRAGWARPAFFAFSYFLVSLFPVMGWFNVYFFRYSFVGDHLQYLAAMGPLALAGAGLWHGLERIGEHRHAIRVSISALLLAVLAALSWSHARVFHSKEILWRDTLAKNPEAWIAHTNLGKLLAIEGRSDEGMEHARRALELKPDLAEAHYNIGKELAQRGQLDAALERYKLALQARPDYAEAHNGIGLVLISRGQLDAALERFKQAVQAKPDFNEALGNLAATLAAQGRWSEAIQLLEQALEMSPDYAEGHNNLGVALGALGRWDEAMARYERALQLKPDYADAHHGLGLALANRGKWTEAIGHYTQALRLNPPYARAHSALANALAAVGRANEAAQHYEEALKLEPDRAMTHFDFALLLASQGQSQEAMQHLSKALYLANAQNNAALAEAIRARLEQLRQPASGALTNP